MNAQSRTAKARPDLQKKTRRAHLEILEDRIAPAVVMTILGSEDATFAGDGASDNTTVFNVDANFIGFYNSGGISSPQTDGVDVIDFGNDLHVRKTLIDNGTLTMTGGGGTDDILFNAGLMTFGGLSATDYDTVQTLPALSTLGGVITIEATGVGSDLTVSGNLSAGGGQPVTLRAGKSIIVNSGADISSSGGAVTLNADRDGDANGGVFILSGGTSITTAGGNIIIGGGVTPLGTVVTGPTDKGIYIEGATLNAQGGDISIRGRGASDGGIENKGIHTVNTTISTTGSGTILLLGAGGNSGDAGDLGIDLTSGSLVQTADGALTLAAGSGNAGGGFNIGVAINDSDVRATGSGAVTVNGTSHSAGANAYGVWLLGAGASVEANGGAIQIFGNAGDGTGNDNKGVFIDGGDVLANGASTILINATGGNGSGSGRVGVEVLGSTALVQSASGALTIIGLSGNSPTGDFNIGVVVNAGTVQATGNGNVTVTGTSIAANAGALQNSGVWVLNSGQVGGQGSGLVQITGTAGAGSGAALDTQTGTNRLGQLSAGTFTGALLLSGNSMALDNLAAGTTGTATLRQNTNGTAIDLGGGDGPGTLGLTDAELDSFTAGTVQIGDANSGALTVSAAITHANNLSLTTGAAIDVNESVTMAVNKNFSAVTTSTTGDINLFNANSDIAATGTGSVTLTAASAIKIQGGLSGATNYPGITTVNGNITLSANVGGTGTGNDDGITVASNHTDRNGIGPVVEATGSGNVTLTGRVSGSGFFSDGSGVAIYESGQVRGGTSGLVTIDGTGTGRGVITVYAGNITTSGASVSVTGVANTRGVQLSHAVASAGGTGTFTVHGTASGSGNATGVFLETGLTTNNGAISVTGINTAAGATSLAYGIWAISTTVTAGGSGTLTMTGTGGSGTGGQNHGINLSGALNSSTGAVQLNGTAGGGADSHGAFFNGGTVSSTGSTVTLNGSARPATVSAEVTATTLAFTAGTDLKIAINGITANSNYDQLGVNGAVSLTGTDLVLSGSYVPTASDSFIIVANDGADAVTGTFNGLPEGTIVNVNGTNKKITYIGGTGNDVALISAAETDLTLSGGNLIITDVGGGTSNDALTVTLNGTNLRISDPTNTLGAGAGMTQVNANTVDVPLASITGNIQLNTLGGNDALSLNFATGSLDRAFVFDGGAAGSDRLSITGDGSNDTATYTPHATTNGSGTIAVNPGSGPLNVTFSNLEPVDVSGMALATITLPNAADVLTVANGFDFATGLVPAIRVSGTSGGVGIETVAFFNNTSVVIDTTTSDGNDTITVTNADNAHANTNLSITTGAGTDVVNVNGGITTTGNLSISTVTLNLGANLQTDGGSITLTGDTRLTASVTIDTETGNNNAAGAVTIGGPVSGNALGRDLTINTNVTGFAGGAVTLGTFAAAGGQNVNDVTIDLSGTTPGLLTLNANIQLNENTTDGAAFTVVGNGDIAIGVAASTTMTIDTDNGDNGANSAGNVNIVAFNNANIWAVNTGVTLAFNARSAATTAANIGGVSHGLIDNNGGANNFFSSVTFNTGSAAGGGAGQITHNGNIFVDGGNITFTDSVPNFATDMTFDTAQGATAVAGSVSFLNSFNSVTVPRDLTIDVSAATTAGNITISGPNNGVGLALNDVSFILSGATPGVLNFSNATQLLNLDNNAADLSSFTVTGGRIALTSGNLTIDTEQGNNAAGGSVDLSGVTSISAAGGTARDLTINTATTFATGNAGNVSLPAFGNAGGNYVNDVTVTASPGAGGSGGVVTLNGNILLDNNGAGTADTAVLTVATGNSIVLTTSLTLDTEQGNDASGGDVNLTGGTNSTVISGNAAGRDLTIDTGTTAAFAAATVALPQFGSTGGGFFVNDVAINQTGTGGTPTLFIDAAASNAATTTGAILLDDDGAGDLASFIVTGTATNRVVISAPGSGLTSLVVTIDTEQGNTAAGGPVNFGAASLAGSTSITRDLVIDTSSTAGAGGDITLAAITSTGGTSLNDFTLNAAGATLGTAGNINFTNGTITTDDPNPTDPATFSVLGGNIRLSATTTINTGVGNTGAVGDVLLAGATSISGTVAGLDLLINDNVSSTVNQAGAPITLPTLNNAAGFYLNDVTMRTSANGAGLNANLTLTGDIMLNESGTDGAAFTFSAAGTGGPGFIIVNPTAGTLTIDTDDGDNGTGLASRNEVLVNNAVRFLPGAAGKALVIDTRSNTNATNQGNVTFGGTNINAGNYFTGLTVNMNTNGSFGTLTLTNDVLVEGNVNVTGPISLGGAAGATRTINTNPDGAGAGGSITVQGATVGSFQGITTNADRDLVLTTAGVGAAGGAIFVGGITGTTTAVNDLTIDTSGTTAGTITLGGNLSVDNNAADIGSISVIGGGNLILGAGVTIETEDANDAAAGDVNFGTSSISGNAIGRDLTINANTTFATGNGGAVVLAGFGNAGGFYINDLALTTTQGTGGTAGQTTLTADVLLDENGNGDPASFNITGNGRVLIDPTAGTTLTVDLDDTDNVSPGAAWSANWASSPVTADTAGVSLVINAKSAATGNFPTASFGPIDNSGGAFLQSFLVDLRGNVSAFAGDQNFAAGNIGTATFNGNIAVDGGAFTVRGNATMNATAGTTRTIDTAQTVTTGGAIAIGGAVNRNSANIDLVLDTSAATQGGAIRLGNGSQVFHSITFSPAGANAATTGDITIAGNFQLDDNTVTVGSAVFNSTGRLLLAATVTAAPDVNPRFDLDAAGGIASGTVNLSTLSSVSAISAGLDLSFNGHSDTAAQPGGNVTLGTFDNAGGAYINDVTVNLQGAANSNAGTLTLLGNILLDNNAADDGTFTYSIGTAGTNSANGSGRIVLGNSVLIDTEQGNDGIGGAVNLSNSGTGANANTISASAAGYDLTINTATTAAASAGGTVTLPNFGSTGGGFFVNDLTIAHGGTTGNPLVSLTGSTLNLDANGADTGDLLITGTTGGTVRTTVTTTIDTEQGDDANGGSITLVGAPLQSGSNANDITFNTGTAFAGGTGGAVSLSGASANGTNYVNDLTIITSAATPGSLTLTGDILLNDNATTDAGSLTVTGGGNVIVAGVITIDTEQGNTTNVNNSLVNLGTGNISASGAARELIINTGDSGTGATGGTVTLGPVNNTGGGSYLVNLSINTDAPTDGLILPGGDIFTDGNMTFVGNTQLAASRTFDSEQGDDGNAGNIDFSSGVSGTLLSASAVGVDLTLNASTAFAGGTGGNVLFRTVGNAGGQFLNDLNIDRSGTTAGLVTLIGPVTTNANGADTGDITITGNGNIDAQNVATLDTDATGGATNAGTLSFVGMTTGTILGDLGTGFSIDTTADGGGTASALTLPTVALTGAGDTFTVNSGALTFGNVSTSNGNIVLNGAGISQNAATTVNSGTGTLALNAGGSAVNLLGSLTSANTTASAITLQNAATVALGNVSATGSAISQFNLGSAANITGAVTQNAGTAITASRVLASVASTLNLGTATNAIGLFTATTSTGNVTLGNTGTLNLGGIAISTSGDILVNNIGTLSTTGVLSTASGTITVNAASPITVAANVTASGDILFSAGEISDAPVWADDFTLTSGATIQSTGGNITLRAGDDIHLNVGTTVNAFGSVTLAAGFGDLDGAGSLDLQGTIISGAGLNLSAPDDIIVGLINAPGQTVTLTADSDDDGDGGVFDTNDVGVDIIADTLIVTGSLQFDAASVGLPATTGIKLETQVNTLTATVGLAPGASTGNLLIVNTGALAVTNAQTNDGVVSLTAAGGNLTVTSATAGGANDVTLATTTSGDILVSSVTASGDDITLNAAGAITDNNGAANNFTALNLSLTAGSGIGSGDALESTVSTLTASNGTGNIELNNTGALTINGTTNGAGQTIISAASPVTIAANMTGAGAITVTAGEIADGPGFADDLTVNAGITVQSTASSVTLQAGDEIITGAGSLIDAATTVTLTAAFGDLDSNGAIQHGGSVTAGGNVLATARNNIALGGNITSSGGDVTLTSTTAAITRTTGTVSGALVDLNAVTGIGASGAEVQTSATTLDFTVSGGDAFLIEANGADVTGSASGSATLTSTTGNWTVTGTGVDAGGNVTMTASAGDILRSGGAADITGTNVALSAGGADGDLGAAGTRLIVAAANTNFTGTGTGDVYLDITGNTNLQGTTGSGVIDAQGGNLTVAGNITTTGNVTLNGSGNLFHSGGTVSGATLDFTAGTNIGTNVNPMQTSGTAINFAVTAGDVFITEANGANVSGTAVGGNVTLVSTTGDWTVVGTGISTAGDVAMTASAGDLLRVGALAIVSANQVTLTAGGADGDIGGALPANRFRTNAATIAFTGTGTGEVSITETNGASISGTTGSGTINLTTTTGDWTFINTGVSTSGNVNAITLGGDLLRSGAAAVVAGSSLVLTASGADGDIGASGNALLTSGSFINFTASGSGDAYLTETDDASIEGTTGATNTDVNLTSTSGSFTLGLIDASATTSIARITAANAILDGNAGTNNLDALAAVLVAGTGIGTSADRIDTSIANLEAQTSTGGIYIAEANALNIGGISAVVGVQATVSGDIEISSGALTIAENISGLDNITLTSSGTITETAGAILTPDTLTTTSVGGQTLNNVGNQIGAFIATNSGAGTNVSLENNFDGFDIGPVSNPTGGNVTIDNTNGVSNDATVVGSVTSGGATGGDIFIATSDLLTVNATVSSAGGTGGTLTIANTVLINASPIVGAGDVTLQGGAGSMLINAPITVAVPLVLTATDNITVNAAVTTTGLNNDLTLLADSDNDGDGGVYVTALGQATAGRDLYVYGSDYTGDLNGPFPAYPGESVRIDADGTNAQLQASRSILVQNRPNAPVGAAIAIGGHIKSTNTNLTIGSILIDSAVEVIDDLAWVYAAGPGSVIFSDTVDSVNGNDLKVQADLGNVNFLGVVGGTDAPGDIVIPNAFNVNVFAGLTADSLTVQNALGTVLYDGPVTTNLAGISHSIHANALEVNAAVTSTDGDIFWEVDNIDLGANVDGADNLTIQPIAVGRSIGLNGTGLLNLTTAEVAFLQDGFAAIQIGRTNGSGTITTNGVTFLDPVSILSPATGGVIQVDGTIDGDDNASVLLQAPTMYFNVTAPTPVISTDSSAVVTLGNIVLQADALIDTTDVGTGGDYTHTGRINGAFAFETEAGTSGDIEIIGVGGVSVGGSAPLDSFTLSGGNIIHRAQTVTTGEQTYTAAGTIDLFSNDLSSTGSGAITFNGAVELNESNVIKTSGIAGADVIFNGTLDSNAGDAGVLQINAGNNGDVVFNGAVGGTELVNRLEVLKAASVIANSTIDIDELFAIKADEVDFDGGPNTVLAGSLTIEPNAALVVRVGAAADSGATTLDFTQDDIAALDDGFASITLTGSTVSGLIIDAAGATFSDPVIFRQALGSGSIDVDGDLTGTDNGSFEFHAGLTTLAANVTTAGGLILLDTGVQLLDDVTLTTAGGNVQINGIVQDTGGGGHNFTIDADAGNVLVKNQLGRKNTPVIGEITINSSGSTEFQSSIIAEGLTTDAGGTTTIRKLITISGATGIQIGDDLLLSAASSLVTTGGGPITISGDIDSATTRALTLNVRSDTGDVSVGGTVGGTNGLFGFNIRTTGDVTVSGPVTAQGAKFQGDAIAIDDVTVAKTLTVRGVSGTFNGAITAGKLTMNLDGSIANTAPWQVAGNASLRSSLGSITITGAGNDFDRIKLRGNNATIETDGTLELLTGTRLTGNADFTSNTGSIIALGSFRASSLTADAANGISFAGTGVRLTTLGAISATTGITIFSGGTNLTLSGVISNVNGDVLISADASNSRGNIINNVGAGAIVISGVGRWVLYSYEAAGTNLNGLVPTFIEVGKRPPTAPNGGGNRAIFAI